MDSVNGRIKLGELAKALGVTNQALRFHLHNDLKNKHNGLSNGHIKDSDKPNGDLLLSIDSILQFLNWLSYNTKQVEKTRIIEVIKEIRWLQSQ